MNYPEYAMRTDLIYVDEQEGSTSRGKYTAIIAAIIPSEKLHAFRSEYYPAAIELLGISQIEGEGRRLDSVPLIHGNSLLRDRSDAEKIKMVDILLGCFVGQGGTFARLGYYNESFIAGMGGSRGSRIQAAITSFAINFSKRSNPFCFIHEMDYEEQKNGYRFLSEQLSQYYQLGPGNVSFDAQNYIGSFIAPKYDLGCQVADASGYVAMKSEVAESVFAQGLAEIFEKYSRYFILNELIWWNDPMKSG